MTTRGPSAAALFLAPAFVLGCAWSDVRISVGGRGLGIGASLEREPARERLEAAAAKRARKNAKRLAQKENGALVGDGYAPLSGCEGDS